MDINTILFDEEYIREQFHKAGLEEGKRLGKREQKREIARNMLRKQSDAQFIMDVTGISAKELESLKKSL